MLYIITGPAGVGKTTISKKLAEIKEKSVLIEGDNIYNQIIGGRVSPWKEGNYLDLFWKICLDMINTYLENGFDVIFNYIVNPENLEMIKDRFNEYQIKFIILLSDKDTLLSRDKLRPLDCQMGNRCTILLENFIAKYPDSKHILDTSNLSIDDIVKLIEKDNKYIIKE